MSSVCDSSTKVAVVARRVGQHFVAPAVRTSSAVSLPSRLTPVKIRQAQVDAAQGHLAQALANLQQAELNLAYTTIRAPMADRVSRKSVELGPALLAAVDLELTSGSWPIYRERADARPARPARHRDR